MGDGHSADYLSVPSQRELLAYRLLGVRLTVAHREWVEADVNTRWYPLREWAKRMGYIAVLFGLMHILDDSFNWLQSLALVLPVTFVFMVVPPFDRWVRRQQLRYHERQWARDSQLTIEEWRGRQSRM